jgi:Zn finger protein HypA/HybF involved in hydrogenase expression
MLFCMTQPEPPSPPQEARGEDAEPMLWCPVCSARLEQKQCKLFCPRCGYYMSCADYY